MAGRQSPYFKDLAIKFRNATGAQRVTIYTRDEFNSAWHSRAVSWTGVNKYDAESFNVPFGQDSILDDVELRKQSKRATYLTFPGIQYDRPDNVFPDGEILDVQSCMVCPVFSDVNVLIGIVECVNKRHQDDATDDEEDSGEEDDIDDEVSDKAMKTGKKKHLYFKRTRIMAEKMRRASTIVVDGLKKLKRMNSKSSKYHSIKRERHLNPGGFTTTDMKRLEVLVQYNANGIQGEGKDMVTMALKIVNSYMQFIGLARGFRVDWPSLLREMFNTQTSFSTVGPKVLSLDCAIGTEPNGTPLYFRKFMASLCIPPFFFVSGILFWGIAYLKGSSAIENSSKDSDPNEDNTSPEVEKMKRKKSYESRY